MADTLARPSPPASTDGDRRPRRPVVDGALLALLAGLTSLGLVALVVLVGAAVDDRTGAATGTVLRAGARVWLVAHGTALEAPPVRFSLVPLGVSALPLALLWRTGRALGRRLDVASVAGAARAALLVAAPYAAFTGLVALATRTSAVEPSPLSALTGSGLLALVGAGAGALTAGGLWRASWLGRRARVRRTLAAASAALTALVGGAALLVGGSLAWHGPRTAELFATAAPGALAGAALLLTCLVYLPTALVWSVSWTVGPGFAVGAETAVGPFGHAVGAVPALPLLAALPDGPVPTAVGVLTMVVPVAAGALAGRCLHRASDGLSRAARALDLLLTSLWTGAAVALLAALSSGAAGGQRLAAVGPSAWRCGLAAAVEVGVAALVATQVLRRVRP